MSLLKTGLNILKKICFNLLSDEDALHDRTHIFFAPPIFEAKISNIPIGVSQSFNTIS